MTVSALGIRSLVIVAGAIGCEPVDSQCPMIAILQPSMLNIVMDGEGACSEVTLESGLTGVSKSVAVVEYQGSCWVQVGGWVDVGATVGDRCDVLVDAPPLRDHCGGEAVCSHVTRVHLATCQVELLDGCGPDPSVVSQN